MNAVMLFETTAAALAHPGFSGAQVWRTLAGAYWGFHALAIDSHGGDFGPSPWAWTIRHEIDGAGDEVAIVEAAHGTGVTVAICERPQSSQGHLARITAGDWEFVLWPGDVRPYWTVIGPDPFEPDHAHALAPLDRTLEMRQEPSLTEALAGAIQAHIQETGSPGHHARALGLIRAAQVAARS